MKDFVVEQQIDYTLVRVTREKLDAKVAPALKSELVLLAGNGEKNFIMDLINCRYCDSSGLSSILIANRLSRNNGGKFVLTGLNDAVERLINVSQLDTVLNITDSLEEAVKNFENVCAECKVEIT